MKTGKVRGKGARERGNGGKAVHVLRSRSQSLVDGAGDEAKWDLRR